MIRISFNCIRLLLLVVALAACSREPPEQRLRDTIGQMQAAIEQREAGKFMAPVAEDFVGNHGLDGKGLERMVRGHLLLNADVGATTGPLQLEISGGNAEVVFSVALSGGSGRLLPERGRLQSIRSHWRDVDGQWQLYRAEWDAGISAP